MGRPRDGSEITSVLVRKGAMVADVGIASSSVAAGRVTDNSGASSGESPFALGELE